MALDAAGTTSNLLNTLFTACLNAKIKHDKIKGMLYCLVGKELDDNVKELFGSLLVDWNDELYNKLRIHSLSLPKLINVQFRGNAVFVGNSGVGKTAIVNRLGGRFGSIPDLDLSSEEPNDGQIPAYGTHDYPSSIGYSCTYLRQKEFNLMVWDTAGQQRYMKMTLQAVNRADFIIIVTDASRPTEDQINSWIRIAQDCGKHWIHVSNKCDIVTRTGHYENHKYKPHFLVSAVSGQGIRELRDFIVLAEVFADHKKKLEFVRETVRRTDAPSIFSHCVVL